MPHSIDPALVVAVLALAFARNVSADEAVHQDKLCEELMSRVVQQADLNFEKSSDKIRTSARSLLDEIVEIAFDCPSLMITVTGHTDNTGNEAANRALSKARAESVVAYLTESGIDPGRLSATGVGSVTPIASNEDAAGRQANRRIEFDLSNENKRYGPFLIH
jgi:OOP family OmpA-OmpF porin